MNNEIKERDVFEANRAYYDLVAKDYLKNESYAYTDEIIADVKRILQLAAGSCGERSYFLDLGCGSGFLSELVSDLNLFNMGAGIDVSEKQLELYNQRLHGRPFTGIIGDAGNLQFSDNSVDMIGGYSVLHHFFDYEKVLRECGRILKPGGCVYFDFEPNARFKKSMKYLVDIRRRVFDRAPIAHSGLEEVAEFHNNFMPGIDPDSLFGKFRGDLKVLEVGYRFPGTFSGKTLKVLSHFNSAFSPLFYVVAQKL